MHKVTGYVLWCHFLTFPSLIFDFHHLQVRALVRILMYWSTAFYDWNKVILGSVRRQTYRRSEYHRKFINKRLIVGGIALGFSLVEGTASIADNWTKKQAFSPTLPNFSILNTTTMLSASLVDCCSVTFLPCQLRLISWVVKSKHTGLTSCNH